MTTPLSLATKKDIAFYQENGFIQFPEFFSKDEIGALKEAIDNAVAVNRERIIGAPQGGRSGEEYERVFNQMVNLWTDYAMVKPFSFDKRLAETARRLSQAKNVRLYHDHAMIKPPGERSKATNWHQDLPYWPMESEGALSAWIAVDEVHLENGCLHFIPRSHKFGKLEPIRLAHEGESIVARMQERGVDLPEPVAIEMPAGGVTFHHGCNFHYAGPNHSEQPRRAFAIIYIPNYVIFTPPKRFSTGGKASEYLLHPILADGST